MIRGQGYGEQTYSMTVFEYNDIYLGLASIYKQGDNSVMDFDTLNLELYWSTNLTEWNKAVPEHNILIPAGAGREKYLDGEFDSATIFASSMTAGDNRIYYMGGKGRHRGWRESGLGLAFVDKDRLAGMVARDPDKPMRFSTQSFKFFGEDLFILADIEANGYYQVRFKGQSLVSASQEKGIPFSITCINTTFWGIRGNFEMNESRYWKG